MNRMSAEHDPQLTNEIIGGGTKYTLSEYKSTTTTLKAVKNILQK